MARVVVKRVWSPKGQTVHPATPPMALGRDANRWHIRPAQARRELIFARRTLVHFAKRHSSDKLFVKEVINVAKTPLATSLPQSCR
jgi:hypothetical protein